MKRFLSLILSVLMVATVFSAAPTVFAEQPEYTPVDSDFQHDYWGSILYSSQVVKVGDWYYRLYEAYTGEKKITDVCGYDGNETVITIPTELNGTQITGMEAFCLFSTSVKTIKIPRGIISIEPGNEWYTRPMYGESVYINCEGDTQLEEIIVESGNRNYWSRDGVLYDGYKLCFYPPQKKDTEYIVPQNIMQIEAGAINTQKYLKSITVTQEVEFIDENSLPDTLENLYLHTVRPLVSNIKDYYYSEMYNGIAYMPKANTIYCIENSEAHDFYKKYNGNQRFCKNLVVLEDEFKKRDDGKWYFYRGGIIDVNANYSSMSFFTKDLVEYKGKWFYTDRGIWTKKTLLYEHKSKWFYIKNGKWERNTTDLIKYKDKWFYVRNGKWNSGDCTLFKKNGKWFAIRSGKWYKGKAIIKYSGKKFYVNKGFVQFDFSGKVKVDGKTYKIKNGKVV